MGESRRHPEPENTLFTLPNCRYCNVFLKHLEKYNMLGNFQIIDVSKTEFDVSQVRHVPTVVVNNNRALSGRDAFAWLQNETKDVVLGVESYGISSAYTYVDKESAEFTMSSSFSTIDAQEGVSPLPASTGSTSDLATEMERLKQERGL